MSEFLDLVNQPVIDVGAVASDIARDLRLDPAYLTRILKKFAAAAIWTPLLAFDIAFRRRQLLLALQLVVKSPKKRLNLTFI